MKINACHNWPGILTAGLATKQLGLREEIGKGLGLGIRLLHYVAIRHPSTQFFIATAHPTQFSPTILPPPNLQIVGQEFFVYLQKNLGSADQPVL